MGGRGREGGDGMVRGFIYPTKRKSRLFKACVRCIRTNDVMES